MIGHIEWTFWGQKLHRYNPFIYNEFWRVVEKVEFFIYNSYVRRILFLYICTGEMDNYSTFSTAFA